MRAWRNFSKHLPQFAELTKEQQVAVLFDIIDMMDEEAIDSYIATKLLRDRLGLIKYSDEMVIKLKTAQKP